MESLEKYKNDIGGYGFHISNCDTDSISVCKPDGSKFTDEEQDLLIDELNSLFPEHIEYEDDGYFEKFIVVKAKNYITVEKKGSKKKITIKGQALKGTGKEKALTDFMNDVIMLMLNNKRDQIYELYRDLAMTIKSGWTPEEWSMKKTVTKSVLNYERKQEEKVFNAIQNIHYQEGDKVRLYVKDKDTLRLVKDYDGEYFEEAYYKKLHDTLKIFGTLLDPTIFPKFQLKKNQDLL